jgi:hypothetical protein
MDMNFVDFAFQEFNCSALSFESSVVTGPISRVHILYDIEPALAEKGEQNIEACALMARYMRTVIQHNVYPIHLADDASEKSRVVLRTNTDSRVASVICNAVRIDINSKYYGLVAEELAPKF